MKPGLDVLPTGAWMAFSLSDDKQKLNAVTFDEAGMYNFHFDAKQRFDSGKQRQYLGIPEAPLPANIKSFECVAIDIEGFYAHAFEFLRKINAIVKDVNLEISSVVPHKLPNLRLIVGRLTPILDKGIHSLHCTAFALPTIGERLGDKLANLKVLKIFHVDDGKNGIRMDDAMRQATAEFILNWLTSPGSDGNGPKLCKAFIDNQDFGQQITKAIREQFQKAKTPSTFALILPSQWVFPASHPPKFVGKEFFLSPEWEIAEFHDTNGIGEELHGMQMDYDNEIFQIQRYQAGRHPELQQWIEATKAKQQDQVIAMAIPPFPMDDAQMDMPDYSGCTQVDKDKKPTTSKQA